MTLSMNTMKKLSFVITTILMATTANACVSNKCHKIDTVYYGENIITVSLVNALNHQLSNAQDLTELSQLEQKVVELNTLIRRKDTQILEIKNTIEKAASENKTKLTDINQVSVAALKITEETIANLKDTLLKSNLDKAKLLLEVGNAKTQRDLLKSGFDLSSKKNQKEIDVMRKERESLLDDIHIKTSDNAKLESENRMFEEKLVENVKNLQSLLSIHTHHENKDIDAEFADVFSRVKKIVKSNSDQAVDLKNTMLESSRDDAVLESINTKAKELSERLKKSLTTGSFTEQLYYITSNDKLTQPQQEYMAKLFNLASKYHNIEIFITGRADPRGKKTYNENLAKDRAIYVKQIAIKSGINPDDIHLDSHVTESKVKENSELHFFDRNTTVIIKRRM